MYSVRHCATTHPDCHLACLSAAVRALCSRSCADGMSEAASDGGKIEVCVGAIRTPRREEEDGEGDGEDNEYDFSRGCFSWSEARQCLERGRTGIPEHVYHDTSEDHACSAFSWLDKRVRRGHLGSRDIVAKTR